MTEVQNPLGWRARLGIIIPTVNTVTEPEFNLILRGLDPEGVTTHFTRMPIHFHPEADGFKSLMADLDERLDELRQCGVAVVAYNCTVGSMACPPDKLIAKLEEAGNALGVSTTGSVLAALKALNVTRIALATPYTTDVNADEKDYFAANGIDIVAMAGMEFEDGPNSDQVPGRNFAAVPPAEIIDHVRGVDCAEAEAIFISCANFGSASVIDALERELRKPVITSNVSTLWFSLRAAGINEQIDGFGKLLAEH